MSTGYKLSETFAKPLASGVIAAVITPPIMGISYMSNLPNLWGMNAPLGIGLASAAATGFGTIAKDWVLPYLPHNMAYAETEGMLVTPVLAGLANTAILWNSFDSSYGYKPHLTAFLTGGASTIGADYLTRTILAPYIK